jgi:protein SCO1/2
VIAEKPKRNASLPAPGIMRTPEPGDAVPDFCLVNQDGKKLNMRQYRGKILLLTFIYTRCPLQDYCPLMSRNSAAVATKLSSDAALRDSVRLLSISIDQKYDKPAVLRHYALEYVGKNSGEALKRWQFASGTPEEVQKLRNSSASAIGEMAGRIFMPW